MRNTSRSMNIGASASISSCRLAYVGALALGVAVGCSQGNGEIIGGGGSSGSRGGNSGGGNGGGSYGNGGSGPIFTLPPTPDAGPDRPGGGQCGDGIIERAEGCDDGNTDSGDGCSASCQIEANWECPEEGKPCKNMAVCGNGKLTSNETCDDGNTDDGDGCAADCKSITEGWICPVPGKKCIPACGDGKILKPETCDDGNPNGGDGCSVTCQTEPGYDCKEAGKACIKSDCGNGKVETGELCDCGSDESKRPSTCKAVNGLFYGDELSRQLRQDPRLRRHLRRWERGPERGMRRRQPGRRRRVLEQVHERRWFQLREQDVARLDQVRVWLGRLPRVANHLPRFSTRERQLGWAPRLLFPRYAVQRIQVIHHGVCPELGWPRQG